MRPAPIDRPYMGSCLEILPFLLNPPGTRDIGGQSLEFSPIQTITVRIVLTYA